MRVCVCYLSTFDADADDPYVERGGFISRKQIWLPITSTLVYTLVRGGGGDSHALFHPFCSVT